MSAPDVAEPLPAPQRRWGLILGVWTLYGLLNATQQHLSTTMAGHPLAWSDVLLLQMPQAYLWALATPPIQMLGRRFPFEGRRWPRSLAVHVLACLVWSFVADVFYAANSALMTPQSAGPDILGRALRIFAVWTVADVALYWSVLSVSYAVDHYRRYRERELAASRLETALAQADLRALKAQMQPHFLFNALHTIGSLVRSGERDSAVHVTTQLGDLLRRILDSAARQDVMLREELDFVRSYLAIEQVRFRDRLTTDIGAETGALSATVPYLVLQPLVENAIRHGIARSTDKGHVSVTVRREGPRLRLTVTDNGPGIRGALKPGIGLSNTRARLSRMYGDDFELRVVNAARGVEASLDLPFRNGESREVDR